MSKVDLHFIPENSDSSSPGFYADGKAWLSSKFTIFSNGRRIAEGIAKSLPFHIKSVNLRNRNSENILLNLARLYLQIDYLYLFCTELCIVYKTLVSEISVWKRYTDGNQQQRIVDGAILDYITSQKNASWLMNWHNLLRSFRVLSNMVVRRRKFGWTGAREWNF